MQILHYRLRRAIDEGLAAGYSLDELDDEEDEDEISPENSYADIVDDEEDDMYSYST